MTKQKTSFLIALALPTIVAFHGCSAGNGADPLNAEADLGSTSQAIGQATCATTTPDATFTGSVNYQSPRTYSNRQCWGAVVVDFTAMQHGYGDVVIAAAGQNLDGWNPGNISPPPSNPPGPRPLPPIDSSRFSIPETVTQAQCENRLLSATLYINDRPFDTRAAAGQWVPPVRRPPPLDFLSTPARCELSAISFGGGSYQQDGTFFARDSRYRLAATYRYTDPRGVITMMPLQILSIEPRCGETGKRCCGPSASFDCNNSACDGNSLCQPCGHVNELACFSTHDGCVNRTTSIGGICRACGDEGSPCCKDAGQVTSYCVGAGLSCDGHNNCAKPVVPPPAPHLGGPGELCKSGDICDAAWLYGCRMSADGSKRCLQLNGPDIAGRLGGPCNNGSCDSPLVCTQVAQNDNRCFNPTGTCGHPGQPCCEPALVGGNPWCVTDQQPTNHCSGSTCTVN